MKVGARKRRERRDRCLRGAVGSGLWAGWRAGRAGGAFFLVVFLAAAGFLVALFFLVAALGFLVAVFFLAMVFLTGVFF